MARKRRSGGERTFDILVDGTVVATQVLAVPKPREFINIEYAVPAPVTQGKERVEIRFQAHPGKTVGRVFACALLRQDMASDPGGAL